MCARAFRPRLLIRTGLFLPASSATIATAAATTTTVSAASAAATEPTTATAATASATATESAAATAATKSTAIGLRTRFIHSQLAAVKRAAVQLLHRCLRFGVVRHLNERKTARLAAVAIPHNVHVIYRSER